VIRPKDGHGSFALRLIGFGRYGLKSRVFDQSGKANQRNQTMKLFIGNLSYDTTEQQLAELLSEIGAIIDFRRPTDFNTGNPRGFAFITMDSQESGEKAIQALDGMKIDGRELKVNEAEERRSAHPADRPARVSMSIPKQRPVDDRPIGKDGQRVRYKGI
jgi:cold-inducible RNA-binding protein